MNYISSGRNPRVLVTFCLALSAALLHVSTAIGETRRPIVGTIPPGTIEVEGGCTHVLKPSRNRADYLERIVFHWGYQGLESPNGKCVSNCLPYMFLFGKVVTVMPLTGWPEDLLHNKEVGDTFTETYRLGSMTIRFRNRITFLCPPNNGSGDVCEVAKFEGVLRVSDGTRNETYETMGHCGL